MKRQQSSDSLLRPRRSHALLLAAAALYLVLLSLKLRYLYQSFATSGDVAVGVSVSGGGREGSALVRSSAIPRGDAVALHRLLERHGDPEQKANPSPGRFGRITGEILWQQAGKRGNFSELNRLAREAWALGAKAWEEAESYEGEIDAATAGPRDCPASVSSPRAPERGLGGEQIVFLPCGLEVGSAITVIGTPHAGRQEHPGGSAEKVSVSQFMFELYGLRAGDVEDPPRMLHLNTRIHGDWSRKPVIEHNTCYRMQWGMPMRCGGSASLDDEEAVDGFRKCEKWDESRTVESKDSKRNSWVNRFIDLAKKSDTTLPFPFSEGRMFVLTIQAGFEGYHIYVGGRHISSFPYRVGFPLEDAAGLAIKGDVDIQSIYATSLPTSHPSFSIQQALDMSEKWNVHPVPKDPIQLFIGILSATNHFAERFAIRKTWLQYPAFQLGNAVARFFVALGPKKEINAALKKEAEHFGDMVILPFMDHYDLVVLKTVAICEHGVNKLTADYIMKCDDDTFVRVDTILKQLSHRNGSIYIGNMNLLHQPLRTGKWAVTFEEWPEEVYPPYADGPGYVISSDIARYIVRQNANHTLRLFKMEDVSMGMWVEEFNTTAPVQYLHSRGFCQHGCIDNYYTAHYQSPSQMVCLWHNLSKGQARCCNSR